MPAEDAFAQGFSGERLDAFDELIAGVDVDTGIAIGERFLSHPVGRPEQGWRMLRSGRMHHPDRLNPESYPKWLLRALIARQRRSSNLLDAPVDPRPAAGSAAQPRQLRHRQQRGSADRTRRLAGAGTTANRCSSSGAKRVPASRICCRRARRPTAMRGGTRELSACRPAAASSTPSTTSKRSTRAARSSLFNLINRLRASGGRLLLAAERAATAARLREDLRTRLGSGLVYRLQPLSDAEKLAALAEQARARGLVLPPRPSLPFARAPRDMRSLTATAHGDRPLLARAQAADHPAAAARGPADLPGFLTSRKKQTHGSRPLRPRQHPDRRRQRL
jgi:hypothetical protein